MTDENKDMTLTPAGGALVNPSELNTAGSAAGEMAKIQAAVVMAHQFPRDETKSWERLTGYCRKKSTAESASYAFPRGGKTVTGPSVQLARLAAQCWGNIRYGLQIISDTDEHVQIRAEAWDVQSGDYSFAEDRFRKLIQRKQQGGGTKWVTPDERDLRELVNRRGAILKRNCLLEIMPRDFIEDALLVCKTTIKSGISDPKAEAKNIILKFQPMNVTVDMINRYLGHEDWSADDCGILLAVYNSMKDGNTKRSDHFDGGKVDDKLDESKKLNLGDLAAREGEE